MAYTCMVLDDIGAEDWVTISRLQGETCLACYSDILVPTRQIFWYLKLDLLVPSYISSSCTGAHVPE